MSDFWVRDDGTINLSQPIVVQTLKKMGWSGCMLDNDCACSQKVHDKDHKITQKFIKDYKDQPPQEVNAPFPWNMTCEKLIGLLQKQHPQALVVFRDGKTLCNIKVLNPEKETIVVQLARNDGEVV